MVKLIAGRSKSRLMTDLSCATSVRKAVDHLNFSIQLLANTTTMSEFFSALVEGKANLSIGSLPLHLLLAALPHWYAIYQAQTNKVQGGWSNENPRAFVARLNARAAAGHKLSSLEELILRGQSAQQNGFEWWAVWAVAVVS